MGRSGTPTQARSEDGLRAHSSAVPKRLFISKEARDAVTLAYMLVAPPAGRQCVPEDEAVARPRAVNGRAALREAAEFVARTVKSGYPATRIHRVLLTAADEPVAAPTAAEAAPENRLCLGTTGYPSSPDIAAISSWLSAGPDS